MSLPNIPDINPEITLTQEEVVNLLLASIALEEIGLAHIINGEAEKIQAVVGTLPNTNVAATTLGELLSINDSVNKTMKTVIKKEMLLQFKLEDVIELIKKLNIHKNTATVEGFFNNVAYTDSDIAYYNTGTGPVNQNNTLLMSKKGVKS